MCVAAVSEVIIEALNIYAAKTADYSPFNQLRMNSWNCSSRTDIRPYIFQYKDVGCHGTVDALTRFGIGQELSFDELQPGDFITMNRTTGSGHTAVFMGYINGTYQGVSTYSGQVAGFRYFSAQGKGKPDAGFAYRCAFFSPNCPDVVPGMTRDCNIIFSHDQTMLNTGFMLHPSAWKISVALEQIRVSYYAKRFREIVGRPIEEEDLKDLRANEPISRFATGLIDSELKAELRFSIPSRYDGVSND
jgi:hypothetical protein